MPQLFDLRTPRVSQEASMRSTLGGEPPPSSELELPRPGPAGLGQLLQAPTALERLWLSWRDTVILTPKTSTSGEERGKSPEGVTLGNEGPGHKEPRNEEPRSEKPGIKTPGHRESCERPPEKPSTQSQATAE